MAPKLSLVIVLLTAVTATLQRKLVSGEDTYVYNNDDALRNILLHLKTHAYKPESRSHSGKHKSEPPSLLNIKTLNLILKSNDAKKNQRSGVQSEDRICPYNDAFCSGTRDDPSEAQQILNELENELDKDPLRCAERCAKTGRCGCKGIQRTDDRDQDQDQDNQLRCRNGRCGRQRNENDKDDDEQSALRCRFGRCGRPNSAANLRTQLESVGKKYRINDDLDAIVVDISNSKDLLNLNGQSKSRNQNFDLDYYGGGDERTANDRDDYDDMDAVVVNLAKEKDDDEDLIRRIVIELLNRAKLKPNEARDPIRPHELADFFEVKKQRVVGNALNFVRNSRGVKDLSVLSKEQQYQLQKMRAQVQRLGSRTDLRQLERKVLDIILGDGLKSEVLPHNENNNNVYIPSWVYLALKDARDDLRTNKRMFPLTNKQKIKYNNSKNAQKSNFARRNVKRGVTSDIGVPFQLQVQGLGQINP